MGDDVTNNAWMINSIIMMAVNIHDRSTLRVKNDGNVRVEFLGLVEGAVDGTIDFISGFSSVDATVVIAIVSKASKRIG